MLTVFSTVSRVTAELLAASPRLKVVGRAGVGVDNVDLEAATARGVVVMNTPGGNAISAAEHTLSMLLGLAKNIPQATASMKEGKWEKGRFLSTELSGKVLGIIGLGRIGSEVAKRAKAFNLRILVHDPYVSAERAEALGVELADLPDLYRHADFVTIHVPGTEETRDLIRADTIAQMKDGVRIVNCARGGIVNEADLYEALRSGKVAGAALDVFAKEPITDSPLFGLPNFISTPHLGAASEEAQEAVAVEIAQQVIDYRKTTPFQIAQDLTKVPGLETTGMPASRLTASVSRSTCVPAAAKLATHANASAITTGEPKRRANSRFCAANGVPSLTRPRPRSAAHLPSLQGTSAGFRMGAQQSNPCRLAPDTLL